MVLLSPASMVFRQSLVCRARLSGSRQANGVRLTATLPLLSTNRPGRTIDHNPFSCRDKLRPPLHTNHRRNTIVAGDNSTMRHGTAHLHYQTTSGKEERRPTWIG